MEKIGYKLRNYPHPYLTDVEMRFLLGGTADSSYAKVKRMLADGTLLHLRRGLYSMSKKVGHRLEPHSFEIAQHLYGPSYISLESALAYHQLIPEAVYSITSVCTKSSKVFKTPLGLFSYLHLPLAQFYTMVTRVHENGYTFFMAKPWKAICDYVFCYKKDWKNLQPLKESLRIELEQLPLLTIKEKEDLENYYHSKRLSLFLKGIYEH